MTEAGVCHKNHNASSATTTKMRIVGSDQRKRDETVKPGTGDQ